MIDLKILDAFYHKAVRRILKINMVQAKEERSKNETLQKMRCSTEPLSTIWQKIVLKFIGRASRQPQNSLSFQFLSCFVPYKRCEGHPFRTIKDSLIGSIRLIMPSEHHSVNYQYWHKNVSNKKKMGIHDKQSWSQNL